LLHSAVVVVRFVYLLCKNLNYNAYNDKKDGLLIKALYTFSD